MGLATGLGLGTFVISLMVHIGWWRSSRPRHEAQFLLLVFGSPALFYFFGWVVCDTAVVWWTLTAALLLHIALSSAYLQIYPAIQADSPSSKVLVQIAHAGPGGLLEDQIWKHLDRQALVNDQIQDLLASGLICESSGFLELTQTGRLFVLPFIWFRRALGAPPPEG